MSAVALAPTVHKFTIVKKSFNPLRLLFFCNHDWGFPVTTQAMREFYPKGFDSHQTCHSCGAKRFYDFSVAESGPEFEEVV